MLKRREFPRLQSGHMHGLRRTRMGDPCEVNVRRNKNGFPLFFLRLIILKYKQVSACQTGR